MTGPLVTAIIPAFGRPNRTQRAIDSVAKQTYSPLELLVIDDGSNPPLSENISLPQNQLKNTEIIRLSENRGANVARNTGIDTANGTLIAFLDSDDEWLPKKIEQQVATLQESNAQAAYTSVKQLDSNGHLNSIRRAKYSGDLRRQLLTGNKIGTFSSFMIPHKAVNDVGKPDPALPCWQDWEWYLRLSDSIQFVGLREPLVLKHNEGKQVSGEFTPKRNHAYRALRERLTNIARTEDEKSTAIAALDFHLGYAALVNEEFSTARSLFIQSILKNPANGNAFKYLAVAGRHYQMARDIKRSFVRAIRPLF